MDDRDIGRSPEPPDEPLPEYLTCIVCEEGYSEEDCIQVHGKCVCAWCAEDVGKARNMVFS